MVCYGEILWDVYPEGKKLGGAPLNVAAHLIQLGTSASIISRVGHDSNGEEILSVMDSYNIPRDLVQKDLTLSTGVVQVTLDEGIPQYEIKMPSSWDNIELAAGLSDRVWAAEALVYGTLALRAKTSRETLFSLLSKSKLNICDLNIRQEYYAKELIEALLKSTHILKINDEEGELLCRLFDLEPSSIYLELRQRFGLDMIIMTKGKDGAELYMDSQIITAEAIQVKVVDTVGSGDAFLAAFIHTYLAGDAVDSALSRACALGGYVATQSGAIPLYKASDFK